LLFVWLHRLSGIHPFQIEEDEDKMLDLIESGKWKWLGPHWPSVSEAAKDLIAKLMEPDPTKRLTAKQALQHPWILVSFHTSFLSLILSICLNYITLKMLFFVLFTHFRVHKRPNFPSKKNSANFKPEKNSKFVNKEKKRRIFFMNHTHFT
jgi:serine/threonine protein kinase